ncbi:MAG TPA: tetratricopeptide repeat protein, partial [Chloroflexia bacterium]|nr:tetratricopeptide repeat protein [Chloroflexia bacterium]
DESVVSRQSSVVSDDEGLGVGGRGSDERVGNRQYAVGSEDESSPIQNPKSKIQNPPAALGLLAALVNKSLLREEAGAEEPRFRMLETIREYGWEQLAAQGELATVQRRHLDVFIALAEAAEPALLGPQQASALRRLEQDHDNMQAALAWALEQADYEGAARLAGALGRFWIVRGYWSEGRRWLEQLLATGAPLARPLRARVLQAAGTLALAQADFPQAETWLAESRDLFAATGDVRGRAQVIARLGAAACDQGRREEGIALYEASLQLFRQAADGWGTASALRSLARVALQRGDGPRVVALSEEALILYQDLGDRWGIAHTLQNLAGAVGFIQGDYGRALRIYDEALALFRQLGAKAPIAQGLVSQCMALIAQESYPPIPMLAAEALALYQEVGSADGVASVFLVQGLVALAQGDLPAAEHHCGASLQLVQDLGHQLEIACVLHGLAAVAAAQGQAARAVRLAAAVARLFQANAAQMDRLDRAIQARTLTAARAQLDAAAFDAAWASGRALPLDQILAAAAPGPDAR